MATWGNMGPYRTPGIGDGIEGNMRMDGSVNLPTDVPQDPYAGQRPETMAFFGQGRKLRDALGYGLGAIAQQFGGQNPYQQQMDAEGEQQRELVKARALAQIRAEIEGNQRQVINLGDGGAATYSPNSGLEMLREPTPDATPFQRNWEFFQNLTPEQQKVARTMLPGAGYTEESFGLRKDLKQATPGKAPSSAKPSAPQYEYRMGPNGNLQKRRVN